MSDKTKPNYFEHQTD